MDKKGKVAVGATLIFSGAVCVLSACGGTDDPLLAVNFSPAPTEDGRPGYILYLPRDTWAFISKHDGMSQAELDQRVHVQVRFMVEMAMRKQSGACVNSWLFSTAANTPDGGVAFGLFCASAEELKAYAAKHAGDDGFRITT